MEEQGVIIWLAPTIAATFAWGIAQGLVKKFVGDVSPATFCLFFAIANACVGTLFWALNGTTDIFAPENQQALRLGLAAYLLDGIAWIFYYQSIVHGPISIVGTLSAAYPAITVLLIAMVGGIVRASPSLGEGLTRFVAVEEITVGQYLGVAGVICGCLALAYTPADAAQKKTNKRWMAFAGAALLIWGVNGLIIKKFYAAPGGTDGNIALFMAMGGIMTLGV